MSEPIEHEYTLHCAGIWYSWSCTCEKTSRHLGPLHTTDRNAKAHVRKARREAVQSKEPTTP